MLQELKTSLALSWSTALAGLANGGVTVSLEIDNSAGLMSRIDAEAIIAAFAGAETGTITLYRRGSDSPGVNSSASILTNDTVIGSWQANGTTAERQEKRVMHEVPSKYFRLIAKWTSSGTNALPAGSDLTARWVAVGVV